MDVMCAAKRTGCSVTLPKGENMKLKYLPNMLCWLRIALCIPILVLFIVEGFTLVGMILFIIAGVSDIIDGPLARRIPGAQSEKGASLDSIADMIMVFVSFGAIIPVMVFGTEHMWIGIGFFIALGYKLLSGVIGNIKYKEMVWLHTYGNKILAATLFSLPIVYYFLASTLPMWFVVYLIIVMILIVVITTEEIAIHLMLKKPSRDIKSVFGVKAANEKRAASEDATATATEKE